MVIQKYQYYIEDKCPACGKERSIKKYRKGMLCKPCAQKRAENTQRFKKGVEHPRWNGGRYIRDGYIFILKPEHPFANNHGYVREHRLIMEKLLERRLRNEEVIHHIDGNTQNNWVDNLRLFANESQHAKHHQMLRAKCIV